MSQHIRAVAMRLPTEHASLTVEGLESLTNITKLSMEAVNVMNTHGHTPSELVAIIQELRECMTEMMPFILEDYYPSFVSPAYKAAVEKLYATLTKTEDFA